MLIDTNNASGGTEASIAERAWKLCTSTNSDAKARVHRESNSVRRGLSEASLNVCNRSIDGVDHFLG